MLSYLPDFTMGIIGFLGFEGLRIYKRIDTDQELVSGNLRNYTLTIAWVAVFSGIIAALMAPSSALFALYAGFSVPSSIKTLFSFNAPIEIGHEAYISTAIESNVNVEVDDIEIDVDETEIIEIPKLTYFQWMKKSYLN